MSPPGTSTCPPEGSTFGAGSYPVFGRTFNDLPTLQSFRRYIPPSTSPSSTTFCARPARPGRFRDRSPRPRRKWRPVMDRVPMPGPRLRGLSIDISGSASKRASPPRPVPHPRRPQPPRHSGWEPPTAPSPTATRSCSTTSASPKTTWPCTRTRRAAQAGSAPSPPAKSFDTEARMLRASDGRSRWRRLGASPSATTRTHPTAPRSFHRHHRS